ncbi:MAG: hypothetical protein DRP93_03435 [Candidatus Neomarinimicrobiota bacterium]|nr:MAG: hypothetical protein DRP93_03435 [Candidatus Neomarinimicrobiota bacterium]
MILDNQNKNLKVHEWITQYTEEGELLMVNKWIGNAGSRRNDNLTKDNLLDGFEILEFVLNNLFAKDKERITKKAVRINRRKKP